MKNLLTLFIYILTLLSISLFPSLPSFGMLCLFICTYGKCKQVLQLWSGAGEMSAGAYGSKFHKRRQHRALCLASFPPHSRALLLRALSDLSLPLSVCVLSQLYRALQSSLISHFSVLCSLHCAPCSLSLSLQAGIFLSLGFVSQRFSKFLPLFLSSVPVSSTSRRCVEDEARFWVFKRNVSVSVCLFVFFFLFP